MSGHTVLVVDDQDEVLVSVRGILERAGHRVVTAQSPTEALAALAAGGAHLALIDQVMPEMSGEELIRQIRATDALLPIILHTGADLGRSPVDLIGELGIQGYHDKSDGPEKLLLWVDAALKSRQPVDALRQRTEQRHDVVAQISHELRNPLQRLGGYTDLLLEGSYGELPEAARPPLQSLARTAHDLTQLVSNFLTHAKLEAGALGIERRRIAVDELATEIRSVAETLLVDRPVRFALELQHAPPALHTDPRALRAILYNLLDNAAKFTSRGLITLYIVGDGAGARVAVADTGPGIAVERQGGLFEPFNRGADADGRPGVGLGLALSRQLATLLGGELSVQSVPGTGSVFTLLLNDVVPNGDAEPYFRPWPDTEEEPVARQAS